MPMLELVITIALFAFISVLLLRFVTAANSLGREAEELGKAALVAESAMEEAKGGLLTMVDGKATMGYDKDWNETTGDAKYSLNVYETEAKKNVGTDGVLHKYSVEVIRAGGEVIFSMTGSSYESGGVCIEQTP